jgi:hypothetical protein
MCICSPSSDPPQHDRAYMLLRRASSGLPHVYRLLLLDLIVIFERTRQIELLCNRDDRMLVLEEARVQDCDSPPSNSSHILLARSGPTLNFLQYDLRSAEMRIVGRTASGRTMDALPLTRTLNSPAATS